MFAGERPALRKTLERGSMAMGRSRRRPVWWKCGQGELGVRGLQRWVAGGDLPPALGEVMDWI